MSIGKNSLARAAAATAARPAAAEEKHPGTFRLVDIATVLPLKGKTVKAEVSDTLAASVASLGVLEPLLLAQTAADELRVLSGNRRLCAARMAGLNTVPAVIFEMTQAEANQVCMELQRFVRTEAEPASIPAPSATAVGQAMPEFLL